MFGLAPRRDCRVSRRPPRENPRGGVLVSVALIRSPLARASPAFRGVRRSVELGLSSPPRCQPGRSDHPAALRHSKSAPPAWGDVFN